MKGILRIRKKNTESLNFSNQKENQPFDGYFSRLIKLIPAEIVSIYILGQNLIPERDKEVLLGFTVICSILLVVIRYQATKEEEESKTQWMAIIISLISFLIFVYSIGSLFELYDLKERWIATLMMAFWVFIIPIIYKGDKSSD
ncbi:hypothetical protein EZY14_007590 [Kordia sp. TARA_039_SRF]|nr:hypothetical protein EZY14_007590 [Kordia sp. TARA_039_SRF]